MFRGGRGFMLVCECEWKWGVSVVGLVVMGSAGGGFSGDGAAGDGEVINPGRHSWATCRPGNAKEADRRLARMINNVSVKLRAAIEEYQLFTQELEASPGWVVNKDRCAEGDVVLRQSYKPESYGYTLEVQRMIRYGNVYIRGSTDDSICYGYTLEVQRMIRYVMVIH
ncbi:hypothetical protein Tco_0841683 [Tanacetum coccineum]|uniref:Uncharacterized protein n=1 Tax=Tanacetum coccineum TaxID=301880 RepID=A0ABQ5AX27_9ASTR